MPRMFACIGHWYMSGLYLVPVAGLVGFLKVSSWRQRRERTRSTPPLTAPR
jgi:hypothetical protein